MSDWHGYPQDDNAHPERPWWVWTHDAVMAVAADNPAGKRPIRGPAWIRADGEIHFSSDGRWPMVRHPQALESIDERRPLPAPPPRCGQVWVWPDMPRRRESVVIDSDPPWFIGPALGLLHGQTFDEIWPPPGAVLVAGPGAPWAPMVK